MSGRKNVEAFAMVLTDKLLAMVSQEIVASGSVDIDGLAERLERKWANGGGDMRGPIVLAFAEKLRLTERGQSGRPFPA